MTKPIQIKNLTIGAGIPKICVPLTGTTEEKSAREAKDAKKAGADLVEWRADFFEGLMDKEACKQVLGKLSKSLERLRFFYYPHKRGRRKYCHLHGRLQRMLPKRCQKPHSRPCGCGSDGKSRREEKLVAELQREGVKIIASSHDFDKTDSQEILLDRFREMEKSGADILKMAVMPHGFEDVAAIMEATQCHEKRVQKPLVSMAMGSIGSISRISGENFGSGITFGTVGAASAPGQFPIGELRSLLEALHKKNLEA
ncbi:MAG: type I 3-dehydroquinate dehydratase [Ruminococcus sp.]